MSLNIFMNTKERILHTALQLFNEKGVSKVSSKSISEEMGISYGNLCYHFPKKDDVILRLHQNLLDELDETFESVEREISEFDFVLISLKNMMKLTEKYCFLFFSSHELQLKYDQIRIKSIDRAKVYHNLLLRISDFLMANGYMNVDEDKESVKMFIHGLLIVYNSWITDSRIYYSEKEPLSKVDYYLKVLFSLLRPSLTKKGVEAFWTIYKK